MDRLESMRVFAAVAELRGFAPAARRLGISPSAATRFVADLEEQLGTRLLQRTTRSVAVTDVGARYLERVKRILGDVQEADAAAQAERTVPFGHLSVAAPNVFGRMHVASLMCDFLSTYPSLTGELTLSDGVANLVDDGLDVAIRIGHLDDSSQVARRVGETRRVVVASPAYLKRTKTPKVPKDLNAHKVIHFTAIGPANEWRFVDGSTDLRVPVVAKYVTNSADAAIGHAERNGGLAMVLGYQVADAVREGRLRIVLPEFEPPVLPIHIVYPTSRLLSAKVRAFVDLALATRDWRFVNF